MGEGNPGWIAVDDSSSGPSVSGSRRDAPTARRPMPLNPWTCACPAWPRGFKKSQTAQAPSRGSPATARELGVLGGRRFGPGSDDRKSSKAGRGEEQDRSEHGKRHENAQLLARLECFAQTN